MSWKTLNEILGCAATDDAFAQELLANPIEAVEKRGYALTAEEREAFRLSTAETLALFSQRVLSNLAHVHANGTR